MTIQSIALSDVEVLPGQNYRDEMIIDDLVESMGAIGQLHPIHVIPAEDGKFRLNSGERRYRAALQLEWEEITAVIMEIEDPLVLEMAAIDENIIRRALRGAALDRALARRKELYLAQNPETAQYVAGAKAVSEPENDRTKSFTEDTADKTGKSPRTIERSVRRAERLSPDTMEAYEQGLISQTQADVLAGLPHSEQVGVLNKVVGKSVEETKAIVSGVLGKPGKPTKTSMQLLEELYANGQKLVAVLGELRNQEDIDDDFIDSVLNLRDNLSEEFETFAAAIGARIDEAFEDVTDDDAPQSVDESEEQSGEDQSVEEQSVEEQSVEEQSVKGQLGEGQLGEELPDGDKPDGDDPDELEYFPIEPPF